MPQFIVTRQPPSQVKVGQALSIDAEFTSSHLKTGYLYMANLDIVGPDGRENGRACPTATCSAAQSPAAGRPQKLHFSFRNISVRKEGNWAFHISIHARKDHLGNDFTWLGEVYTEGFNAKK